MGLDPADPFTPIRNALYIRGGTLGGILLFFAARRDARERDDNEPWQRFFRCVLQAGASFATLLLGFGVLLLLREKLSYKAGVLRGEAGAAILDSLNRSIEGCLNYDYDCKTIGDNLGVYDVLDATGTDSTILVFDQKVPR